MTWGEAESESYYDWYYNHQLYIYADDRLVIQGYITLYRDTHLSRYNYPGFRQYEYLPDGPAHPEMIPDMQYAEQWEIGCRVSEHRNWEHCELIASYKEFLLHMTLITEEALRFDDFPEIMEQAAMLLEAQDRQFGEMLDLDL